MPLGIFDFETYLRGFGIFYFWDPFKEHLDGFGRSWGHLAVIWGTLGAVLGILGVILGYLGPSWEGLGCRFEDSWCLSVSLILKRTWVALVRFTFRMLLRNLCRVLRALGGILGWSWALWKASWESKRRMDREVC